MRSPFESLFARAGAIRSRALVRRCEMRQLGHAAGVWFRLGRLLAFARSAWALSEGDADLLFAAGHSPHPVGLELEPPRRLFIIAEEKLASLASAREVALRASPEILGCRTLALVPFEGLDPDHQLLPPPTKRLGPPSPREPRPATRRSRPGQEDV